MSLDEVYEPERYCVFRFLYPSSCLVEERGLLLEARLGGLVKGEGDVDKKDGCCWGLVSVSKIVVLLGPLESRALS